MRNRVFCLAAMSGLLGAGVWVADEPQAKFVPAPVDTSRDADREAIVQSARDFATAYEKGDAKAVADFWTEQGEYESDDGVVLRGRTAIEAAFAAHFKVKPPGKMEIKVENIRFPSRDSAIEEGLTRTLAADSLPDSAYYRVLHVREDGKWRIAMSREWGAAENRLADLEWLLGSWTGKAKDQEWTISFNRDKDQPFIFGEFAAIVAGKSTSLGTMKIGIDPTTGQIQSWHFDPDGGHGHGWWIRERNHWILDSRGVQGDGAPITAVNILTRLGSDEIGWRSIDRKVGGQSQPDTAPLKLKRLAAAK